MRAAFIEKFQQTPDVWTYFFKPETSFDYAPGSFLYLTLPKIKNDPRGDTRHFSISSSPTEKLIAITAKDGVSEYKNVLQKLQKGDEVQIDAPHGVYHWSYEESQPHIFIAGGIGITPFRSRLKHNSDKNINAPIHLIYSYRTHMTFENDLSKFVQDHSWLTVTNHNTSQKPRLCAPLSEILNVKNEIVWICGSTSFVNDIEDMLLDLKIPSEQIKTEKFTGY